MTYKNKPGNAKANERKELIELVGGNKEIDP